jgi:hypothetical protein
MQTGLGGEMDITSDFESDIPGSNPGRGTGNQKVEYATISQRCGHGLVVERVLAKDETGFRLSLPALTKM